MKDGTLSGKDLVSIIVFLLHLRTACYACNIIDGAAMWLFRNYLAGALEAVIKAQVGRPTENTNSKEGCITSFSAIVNYLLRWFATDYYIAKINADIQNTKQNIVTVSDYSQNLWKETLKGGSVYSKKILKGLFIESMHRSIFLTLHQWRSEYKNASTKDFVLNGRSFTDLQGKILRSEKPGDRQQWRPTDSVQKQPKPIIARPPGDEYRMPISNQCLASSFIPVSNNHKCVQRHGDADYQSLRCSRVRRARLGPRYVNDLYGDLQNISQRKSSDWKMPINQEQNVLYWDLKQVHEVFAKPARLLERRGSWNCQLSLVSQEYLAESQPLSVGKSKWDQSPGASNNNNDDRNH